MVQIFSSFSNIVIAFSSTYRLCVLGLLDENPVNRSSVNLIWVPDHSSLTGNEWADELALIRASESASEQIV